MGNKNNIDTFFGLLRLGLWENTGCGQNDSLVYDGVDWGEVYDLALEQGVVGLVAAGLETCGWPVPLEVKMQFAWGALRPIEQRNAQMNAFISDLVEGMRRDGIHTVLVKGQGVAQCYERPLWRPSGDVDFLLDGVNYKKARDYLLPLSTENKKEERYSRHMGICTGEWDVEIHGSLRTGLSERIDKMIDIVQHEVLDGDKVRVWKEKTDIFLPAPAEDVFLVFTHFIKHFYKEGIMLRQLCDWCRLLWTYRDSLDYRLLEAWITRAGLMQEWRTFGTFAVNWLGMPSEAMPYLSQNDSDNSMNAGRMAGFILTGSRGKIRDTYEVGRIFPWHTLKFLPSIFFNVNWLKVKERIFKCA